VELSGPHRGGTYGFRAWQRVRRFGGPSLAPSYFFTTRDVHEFSRFNVVEWPGVQHEGYVTRYKIPNGSGLWQWNWVCQECFAKLSETMQWRSEDP